MLDRSGGLLRGEPPHALDAFAFGVGLEGGFGAQHLHQVQVDGLEARSAPRCHEAVPDLVDLSERSQRVGEAGLFGDLPSGRLFGRLAALELSLGDLPGDAAPPLDLDEEDL